MAQEITLTVGGIQHESILPILQKNNIRTNEYARVFMDHPDFQSNAPQSPVRLMITTPKELGWEHSVAFPGILGVAKQHGLQPCAPCVGLYLRLHLLNQPVSKSLTLSCTQQAPEGAITVVSQLLDSRPDFPRGLYLRNVGGELWLRGYVCDDAYMWNPTDVFVFEAN